MATSNQLLVADNSTLANFKAWAQAVSTFFTTAGWAQTADTGQVNWGTIAVVPSVNTYVYEIWQPNDGLTNFYVKLELGTGAGSSNTQPIMRLSIGTSTNGAGVLGGFVTTAQRFPSASFVVPTPVSTTYNCYFSGAPGRMHMMLWRDHSNASGGSITFSIERSKDATGADTSTHVTLTTIGQENITVLRGIFQQSIIFGVGAGFSIDVGNAGSCLICLKNQTASSALVGGNISISPIFADVGYFDNPLLGLAVASVNDVTEGSTYTISSGNMPYGVAHTYIAAKTGNHYRALAGVSSVTCALLMRYD